MARKQSDYLAALLAEDGAGEAPFPAPPAAERPRAATLLGRETALARVASGEVRQVTQLLLDPARVRIWPGNARTYAHLPEENCRELIDSLVAEGGQKVPAVVRRVEGDATHDYEVIAGTRRHWSVSWLRAHSYPDMQFVAQVASLDDEAAFRLADLENRARADVSDLERARNYAVALKTHYGDHQTRMAERLKLSKGWLSNMRERSVDTPGTRIGSRVTGLAGNRDVILPVARELGVGITAYGVLARGLISGHWRPIPRRRGTCGPVRPGSSRGMSGPISTWSRRCARWQHPRGSASRGSSSPGSSRREPTPCPWSARAAATG